MPNYNDDDEIYRIMREHFNFTKYQVRNNVIDATNVVLKDYDITRLPVQFGKVDFYFNCDSCELTTLLGCPETVRGCFKCFNNELTDLIGGPKSVDSFYECFDNPLKSFDGLPDHVGGSFCCDYLLGVPMLRLLKFKNGIRVKHQKGLQEILNRYAGQTPLRPAIIKCQRELIDNGFETIARL